MRTLAFGECEGSAANVPSEGEAGTKLRRDAPRRLTPGATDQGQIGPWDKVVLEARARAPKSTCGAPSVV